MTKYFKPWTTFGVGVVFGIFVYPKIKAMTGK